MDTPCFVGIPCGAVCFGALELERGRARCVVDVVHEHAA